MAIAKGAVSVGTLETAKADLLIVFTNEDGDSAEFKRADTLLGGELARLRAAKEFAAKPLSTLLVRTPRTPCSKVLLVGLGLRKSVTLETLRRASGVAAKAAREVSKDVTIPFTADTKAAGRLALAAQAVTEGLLLGDYRFLRYKTREVEQFKQLSRFTLLVEQKGQRKAAEQGLARGAVLATATAMARDLIATPAADMNPASLEAAARTLAKKHGLKVTVFDEKELQKRGMNALYSVGKGSAIPPRMILLEYKRPGAKRKLVFCGKGVCYDSGGYNLKTMMLEVMKDDMGGAAALLGMLDAVATLKVKADVTVVIGAAENLISGSAYKTGDILNAMNGKTIEVLNTDAEGRLVLADCLAYASTLAPHTLLDIATLTGAAKVALGTIAGVLTPNDKLAANLIAVGEETGDRAWRLPLWDDHKEDVKSDLADVKNMGYPMTAAVTAGAVFLQEFVEKPETWAHLDIGGAVYDDRERPYLPKGPTGWGVRFLTRFVEKNA